MNQTGLGWLAFEYHFPTTYSCRFPLSSSNSALISPAPGPATVRLALIRVGIEVFGRDVVRDKLFPTLRNRATRCSLTPDRDNTSRNARGDSFPHMLRYFKRLIAMTIFYTDLSLKLHGNGFYHCIRENPVHRE
jgi:hypothetical protein